MAEVVVVVLASPLTQLVNVQSAVVQLSVVLPGLLVVLVVTLRLLSTNDDALLLSA